jgi:hypothetical protein
MGFASGPSSSMIFGDFIEELNHQGCMSSLSLSPLNKSPGYSFLYWSHLVNVMLQHVGIHHWMRRTGEPPIKGCACALISDSFLGG